jgi:hypothetical protein
MGINNLPAVGSGIYFTTQARMGINTIQPAYVVDIGAKPDVTSLNVIMLR